jgi:hypothetical protein
MHERLDRDGPFPMLFKALYHNPAIRLVPCSLVCVYSRCTVALLHTIFDISRDVRRRTKHNKQQAVETWCPSRFIEGSTIILI